MFIIAHGKTAGYTALKAKRMGMKAFSLVELSIVLVILGLLTGGIIAGRSLIRATELHNFTTEFSKYATAVQTFNERYMSLPGDIPNATDLWGVLAGDGFNATCQNTPATGASTCNGTGDGWIMHTSGDTVPFGERFRAWQHLANAGLIEGKYTGVKSGTADYTWTARVNVPAGSVPNTSFQLEAISAVPVVASLPFLGTKLGHYLNLISSSYNSSAGILTPEEAWNIDNKLDDGLPATGAISTYDNSGHSGCVTSDNPLTAEYAVTLNNKSCIALLYRIN